MDLCNIYSTDRQRCFYKYQVTVEDYLDDFLYLFCRNKKIANVYISEDDQTVAVFDTDKLIEVYRPAVYKQVKTGENPKVKRGKYLLIEELSTVNQGSGPTNDIPPPADDAEAAPTEAAQTSKTSITVAAHTSEKSNAAPSQHSPNELGNRTSHAQPLRKGKKWETFINEDIKGKHLDEIPGIGKTFCENLKNSYDLKEASDLLERYKERTKVSDDGVVAGEGDFKIYLEEGCQSSPGHSHYILTCIAALREYHKRQLNKVK